jgi:hypothetical protein
MTKLHPKKVTCSTHYACNYGVSHIVKKFVILCDLHENVPIKATTIPTHQEYICIMSIHMLAKLSRFEELESPLQCSQPRGLVMIFAYVQVLLVLLKVIAIIHLYVLLHDH